MTTAAIAPLDHDAPLVALWLHGRPPRTQRVYGADLRRFLAYCGKPVATITLADLQAFADTLTELAPAPRLARSCARGYASRYQAGGPPRPGAGRPGGRG